MPKPINISVIEKDYIKNALEKYFNVNITDTNDCKLLSDLILQETGSLISYNTLRRLFRIIPSQAGISLHTLNLLAQTVQFTNWYEFQKSISEHRLAQRNHIIFYYRKQQKIDHDYIVSLLIKMKFENWEEAYWLKAIVKLALDIKDYEIIKKILLHLIDVDLMTHLDKIYFGLQDIFFELPHNNQIAELLVENLSGSPIIQFVFVECYVNEDELNGYFGRLLDAYVIIKKDDPQTQLFYTLMQCQKEYQYGKDETIIKLHFNNALKIFKDADHKGFHPIVLGRLAAWEWIISGTSNTYEESVNQLKTGLDWAHFKDFYHRLCVLFSNHDSLPSLINVPEEFANKHKEHLPFFDERIYTHEYLQMAINSYLQNDHKSAREWHKKVNPTNFDFTMLDWYLDWYNKLDKNLN
jgi:hypothetical protein